jgi:hypothetical protein
MLVNIHCGLVRSNEAGIKHTRTCNCGLGLNGDSVKAPQPKSLPSSRALNIDAGSKHGSHLHLWIWLLVETDAQGERH